MTFSTYTCPAHYDDSTIEEDTSDPTDHGPDANFYSDANGDGGTTWEEQRPVDVDIALCEFQSDQYEEIPEDGCRYFSDSIHDTNEGFDVILDKNMSNPALIAIHRAKAEACRGGRTFPHYWSVWYWPA